MRTVEKIIIILFFLSYGGTILFAQWNGTGSQSDPYLISNAGELKALSDLVLEDNTLTCDATNGKYWRVIADIDMTEITNFIPIGGWKSATANEYRKHYFSGTFNGGGKTISNLTIEKADKECVGLFGYTARNAFIDSLTLKSFRITGYRLVGALVGINSANIENCAVVESVIMGDSNQIGGLVGSNSATISNCYADCHVSATGSGYSGVLVGSSSGVIKECFARGVVVSEYGNVGGLVGINEGKINNSYAVASVTGNANTGGLVGICYGSISNSYAVPLSLTSTDQDGNIGVLIGSLLSSQYSSGAKPGNCYYLQTEGVNAIGDNDYGGVMDVSAKTAEEMKDISIVNLLNNGQNPAPWKTSEAVNRFSYPSLKWQETSSYLSSDYSKVKLPKEDKTGGDGKNSKETNNIWMLATIILLLIILIFYTIYAIRLIRENTALRKQLKNNK